MSDRTMLGENELRQVGNYVKQNLRGWMEELSPDRQAISTQLLERMEHRSIRMEEELKAQRELMEVRFDAVDRRFEAVDQRFEAVDKRFEAVDKRFALLQWVMGVGFVMVGTLVTVFGLLA